MSVWISTAAGGCDDLLGKVEVAQGEVARFRHAHVDQIQRNAGQLAQAGPEAGGLVGPPRRPREVGKDVDFLGRQILFLSTPAASLTIWLSDRGLGAVSSFSIRSGSGRDRRRSSAARCSNRRLRSGSPAAIGPAASGRFPGRLPGGCSCRAGTACAARRRRSARLPRGPRLPSRDELNARPGQGQGQQGDRPGAEQQEQQMSQAEPPLVGVVPLLQKRRAGNSSNFGLRHMIKCRMIGITMSPCRPKVRR